MQTVEEALKEFHTTYGLTVKDKPDSFEDFELDIHYLRTNLIEEEFSEVSEALSDLQVAEVVEDHEQALVALADAICDSVYVLVGTAVSYGIPFDRCFAEVQRSNMSKLGEDGKPIVREDGKILKGPNFSPPDLHTIIYGGDNVSSDH